jgi:hypothetical protein
MFLLNSKSFSYSTEPDTKDAKDILHIKVRRNASERYAWRAKILIGIRLDSSMNDLAGDIKSRRSGIAVMATSV